MMKPIVFYDGSCPLCSKEINFFKKLKDGKTIDWFDISRSDTLLIEHNILFKDAMTFLHVIDSKGQIKIGADAFIVIWKQFYQFRFIAYTLETLNLVPVMEYFYKYFAKWRLEKKKCDRYSCSPSNKYYDNS